MDKKNWWHFLFGSSKRTVITIGVVIGIVLLLMLRFDTGFRHGAESLVFFGLTIAFVLGLVGWILKGLAPKRGK